MIQCTVAAACDGDDDACNGLALFFGERESSITQLEWRTGRSASYRIRHSRRIASALGTAETRMFLTLPAL